MSLQKRFSIECVNNKISHPEMEIALSQYLVRKRKSLGRSRDFRDKARVELSFWSQQCSTQDVWYEEWAPSSRVSVSQDQEVSLSLAPLTQPSRSHQLKCDILSRTGICRSSPGGTSTPHLNPNPVLERSSSTRVRNWYGEEQYTKPWRNQDWLAEGWIQFLWLVFHSLCESGSCGWLLNDYFNELLQFSHIISFP